MLDKFPGSLNGLLIQIHVLAESVQSLSGKILCHFRQEHITASLKFLW